MVDHVNGRILGSVISNVSRSVTGQRNEEATISQSVSFVAVPPRSPHTISKAEGATQHTHRSGHLEFSGVWSRVVKKPHVSDCLHCALTSIEACAWVRHRLDGRLRSPRSTQVLSTRSLGLLNFASDVSATNAKRVNVNMCLSGSISKERHSGCQRYMKALFASGPLLS
jgi:hypothetical protein